MGDNVVRGTFYMTLAYLLFAVGGYAVYVGLGRYLLTPAEFGIYSVVVSFIAVINTLLIAGTKQSTAKFVSESPAQGEGIRRQMLSFQIVAALLLSSIIYFLSPNIAQFFNDPSYTPFLQITSLLILFRPAFTVMDGFANGTKQFMKQGHLTTFLMLSKTVLILLLAFLYGLQGAFLGFVLAILISSLFALYLGGIPRRAGPFPLPWPALLAFLVPVAAFSLIANLLQTLDLLLVKALLPMAESNVMAGYYSAASTISKIPWTLTLGLSFAVFPYISASRFQENFTRTRFYITTALRYSILFLLPLVIIMHQTSPELLEWLFSPAYAPAAGALAILVIGMGGYALLTVLISIFQSLNRPYTVVGIGALLLVLNAALNYLWIPVLGIEGAALATTVAVSVGVLLFLLLLALQHRISVPVLSFLRILFAGTILYFLSPFLPAASLWLLGKYALLFFLYTVLLFLLREISVSECRDLLRRVG